MQTLHTAPCDRNSIAGFAQEVIAGFASKKAPFFWRRPPFRRLKPCQVAMSICPRIGRLNNPTPNTWMAWVPCFSTMVLIPNSVTGAFHSASIVMRSEGTPY